MRREHRLPGQLSRWRREIESRGREKPKTSINSASPAPKPEVNPLSVSESVESPVPLSSELAPTRIDTVGSELDKLGKIVKEIGELGRSTVSMLNTTMTDEERVNYLSGLPEQAQDKLKSWGLKLPAPKTRQELIEGEIEVLEQENNNLAK